MDADDVIVCEPPDTLTKLRPWHCHDLVGHEPARRLEAVAVRRLDEDAKQGRVRGICGKDSFAVEQGAWYLVAHCDRSEAIRIFRLDRVSELTLMETSFESSEHPPAEELFADGRAFVGSPPEKLRVRYSARVARWISEREQGVANADGTFEVEYPMGDQSWGVRHVLQYGPEAEVVSPASVRESVRESLRRAIS